MSETEALRAQIRQLEAQLERQQALLEHEARLRQTAEAALEALRRERSGAPQD